MKGNTNGGYGKGYESPKKTADANLGKSIPSDIESSSNAKQIRWVPIGISAAAIIVGSVMTIMGNSSAKAAYEDYNPWETSLDDAKSDAKKWKNIRAAGIGVAILGAVGLGFSIAF